VSPNTIEVFMQGLFAFSFAIERMSAYMCVITDLTISVSG
jgi:hypothetical protein